MRELRLIEDARDIDRIVGVDGVELRTGYSAIMNSPHIYDPFTGTILDYFTMDELDMIMGEGETHTLDPVAGTVYTVINW
jgi:hypothetical protein